MNKMEDTKVSIMETIYQTIYEESMRAHENIIKTYPSFQDDMRKANWIQKWKLDNPDANDIETIAHAYTMIILSYLFAIASE